MFDKFDVVFTANIGATTTANASITYKGQTYTMSVSGGSTQGTRTLTIGNYTFVLSAWYYGGSFTTQDYSLSTPLQTSGSGSFRKEVSLALAKTPNGNDAIGVY